MKKQVTFFALLSSVLLLVPSFKSSVSKVYADGFDKIVFESEYKLNDVISLNKTSVEINGMNVVATPYIVSPTGVKSYSSSYTINEFGKYTITYYAVVNNKYYSRDFVFDVNPEIISVGANSSYKYEVPQNSSTPAINVSLARGESITFNKPIDLTKITKSDDLINAFIVPKKSGEFDFRTLKFWFRDITDPSNYIMMRVNDINNPNYSCYGNLACQADGTNLCGFIESSYKGPFVAVNSSSGTQFAVSFNGLYNGYVQDGKTNTRYNGVVKDNDTCPIVLKYNYDTKEVFVRDYWFDQYGTYYGSPVKICDDFDDPFYNGVKLWKGFKSGMVRLTVTADSYENDYANFAISHVFGLDLTDTEIKDTTAPEISVEGGEILEDGKVDYKYPIPKATAIDNFFGVTDVKTAVWYNYGSDIASTADVRGNDFYPTKTGVYTFEYRAKDGFGNERIKTVNVNIVNDVPALNVSFPELPKSSYSTGEAIKAVAPNVSGGVGKTNVSVDVIKDSEIYDISSSLKYVTEKSGEYILRYIVTDKIGQTFVKSFPITVSNSDSPILSEEIIFPKFAIAYSDFEIPNANAVDYSTGMKKQADIDVSVTLNGNTYEYKPGDFVPMVDAPHGGKISLTYHKGNNVIGSKEIEIVNPYTIGEYDSYNLDSAKYFVSNTLNVTNPYQDKNTPNEMIGNKVVSKQDGDSSFIFANPLLAKRFSIDYSLFNGFSHFNSVKLTLIDAADENNAVSIGIRQNSGSFLLFGTDVADTPLNDISYGTRNYVTFNTTFDGKAFQLGGFTLAPTVNDQGNPFDGFKSEKVYMKLEFENFKRDDYIYVNQICGYKFVYTTEDDGAPLAYFKSEYNQTLKVGDIYVTPDVVSGDVLCPTTVVTLTVRDQDSQVLTDVNGKKLLNVDGSKNYEIKLEKYGVVNLTYKIREKSVYGEYWPTENEATLSQNISCIDTASPIITFTSTMVTTCNVNDTVALSQVKVSDNATATENIYVMKYMILPDSKTVKLPNNVDSFKFTAPGIYEFRVTAMDEAGNITVASHFITVK